MKLKIPAAILALIVMTAVAGRLEAGTDQAAVPVPSGFMIASPDHPSTFEVGFNDKVGQSLRWSEGDRMLYLDVTYSRITYTDLISPANFKTYTVVFPGVMLDAADRLYVVNGDRRKIVIGRREHGPFGVQIRLNEGVAISAHRHEGRINAMLVGKNRI